MSHSVAKKVFDYIIRQPKLSDTAPALFAVAEYISINEKELSFIGATPEKRNEVYKWVEFAVNREGKFTDNDAKELDAALLKSTFVAYNHTISAADIFNFISAHDYVTAHANKITNYPSLFRWIDLIQHSFGGATEWKDKIFVNTNTTLSKTVTSIAPSESIATSTSTSTTTTTTTNTTNAVDAKHAAKLAKKEAKLAEKNAKKESKQSEKEAKADVNPVVKTGPTPAASQAKKTLEVSNVVGPDADPTRLDVRVGLIIEATKHPDAETLYVEKMDVGEDEPRTIISGLVNHVPIEEMQQRPCLVLCNLKPVKMRGILSQGMVLCTTGSDGKIEILSPPEGAKPGDLIEYLGYEGGAGPDAQLNPKKKVWESIQPGLFTNDECIAGFIKHDGIFCSMQVNGNNVIAPTVANGPIR